MHLQQMLVSSLLSRQIMTNYHSKRKKEGNNNTLITKTNSFPSPLVYTNHHHILNTKTNKHRINLNIEIIVIIYTPIFDCKLYYHDHTEACETLLTTLLPS